MASNFEFYSPTRVIFGKGTEQRVGALVREYGGTRVLIVYGGKSAVRSGVLDRAEKSLAEAGISSWTLGGVVPNPHLDKVYEGIRIGKENSIDFLLAVGGGSVIDTAKAIAYGLAEPEKDVWELYEHTRTASKCLPVASILTIAAAGSETSNSSVITRVDTHQKRAYNDDISRPKFALMDPELTKTLPDYQTESGCADIMMHTMERYFTNGGNMELTDVLAEGLLRTVMKNAVILHTDPANYEARAEVMWAGSLSHNGLTGCGIASGDFMSHKLEHEMGGMFDVTHGAGLAALWPSWARYVYKDCLPRFVRFARNVMGVTTDGTDLDILESPFRKMFSVRVFWLVLLTLFGVVTSTFVAAQEEILSQVIVLAAFIAPIVDMGGNAGSQSATLVIRAMALGDVSLRWQDVWRVVRRELPVAAALGLVVAGMETVLAWFSKGIDLDVLLVVGAGMGVAGAALATILSQGLSCIWVLRFLTGPKTLLRLKKENVRFRPALILPCVALGTATFIMQASESVISVCFNSSLLKYGDDIAVGAMTILSSVMQFAMLPLQGIAQGAQPITSYNYGARNTQRVRQTFRLLLKVCLCYSVALWAVIQLCPGAFARIFTPNAALVAFTVPALRIYCGALFLFGIQIACQMTFVSIGAAGCSIIVAVLRKFVLLLPLIYLMPRLLADQTMAVYTAEPVADAIAVTCTAILFTVQFRKALRKLDAED